MKERQGENWRGPASDRNFALIDVDGREFYLKHGTHRLMASGVVPALQIADWEPRLEAARRLAKPGMRVVYGLLLGLV